MKKRIIISMMMSFMMVGCQVVENTEAVVNTPINVIEEKTDNGDLTSELSDEVDDLFAGYTVIEVDGGDKSGERISNVAVDIGFGGREYWAFTNEYGQLVKVVADEIILQDDDTEPVTSKGRYYSDEAYVPGVERSDLDQGHVIADSLGGVSNAYNICPQDSTLNRHGDQAYMERAIREAGGCTNFVAIITYPDEETQIPSHYSYTYTLVGNVINDEFDNVNPDEVNAALIEEEKTLENKTEIVASESNGVVEIVELDKKAEYIVVENKSDVTMDLSGWKIVSVKGNQTFEFPDFELEPGNRMKIGDSEKNPDVDFHWLEGKGVWNNSKSDPAELYDESGKVVDYFED